MKGRIFKNLTFGRLIRDTCIAKNEKLESFNLESLRLKSFCLSWKEPSEVGKDRAKLERFERNWEVSSAVGKFWVKLESFNELGKLSRVKLDWVTVMLVT